MGMPISIHLRGEDVESPMVAQVVEDVFELLREVDRLFSTYRDDSEVNRIRRGELDAEHADPLVQQVIALCQQAGELTKGAFTDQLPDDQGVLRFDPTGLVKGWAADRAANRLAELSGLSFLLNAGGDVVVGGTDGSGALWRVGIEDPRDRSRVAQVVELHHGGVATSGTAARGAHLYDPNAQTFVDRAGSITVIGPRLMWADVWATALFVGSKSLMLRFSEVADGYRVI
ncbi:MAG: FAD:protein FMN transferase, partial [Phycicoccus sp.]|nr:FAD:protein FMN transferase [Phycicoccus sp.]